MLQRLLFMSCAIFAAVLPSTAQSDELFCKDLHEISDMERRGHEGLIGFRSSPFTDNYDLKYHRLEWTIDPAQIYINGSVTSYFQTRSADFQEINFDLVQELTVSEVRYHGQELNFMQHSDDRLQIFLPAPLAEEQLDSVTVIYEGAPPQSGFGSFVKATHAGTPILWTLSEPYGARDWWPCKQDLNDKIDSIDVFVRTPVAYRTASNGLLQSETVIGNEKICHWKHRYPIPTYLIGIAVTNYATYSEFVPVPNGEPIEVLNYVYPEFMATAQTETPATIAVMQLFNELVGLYPFANEKYGHAQFGWGGGIEHQTMSFMGGFSYGLQAHELAHQWFGDKITCGSWEDIWLNEGFATYLTGMTYENGLGNQNWRNWLQSTITQITNVPDGSVWVDDTTSVSRIFSGRLTYSKGAMVLHMLRWKLGDAAFFQAVRNYIADPDLAYGYARTADLVAHLEAQSGLDLTEFMDDWFYGQGHPSYQLEWFRGADDHDVHLILGQTSSHPSVSFFEMPVAIQFSGEGQDSTVVLDHTFSGQSLSITLPFVAQTATIDPDLWIVSANNTVNMTTSISDPLDTIHYAMRVYPNPTTDQLQIDIYGNQIPSSLKIHNALGQIVLTQKPESQRILLNLKDLATGMYVLEIMVGERTLVQKVVKE